MKGQLRCARHGGKSPQAKKTAERRLVEQEAARNMEKAVRTLGITEKYADVGPGKALLEEISVTYAHVQWLREKVAELEGDELVWGKNLHREGVGPEGLVDVSDHKAATSNWYDLYLQEREHLVKVITAALMAGIEERKVRLAESQGELVARAIRGNLEALNLTADQWELIQTVVPSSCAHSPQNKRQDTAWHTIKCVLVGDDKGMALRGCATNRGAINGIHLCHGHTKRLEETLREVPAAWSSIRTTVCKLDVGVGSVGGMGGAASSSEPANLGGLDKAQTLSVILSG